MITLLNVDYSSAVYSQIVFALILVLLRGRWSRKSFSAWGEEEEEEERLVRIFSKVSKEERVALTLFFNNFLS